MLAALALVFIVLVQNSKGGGLASGFASSNNIMGVRKTTDVLEKSTWWFAGTVMILCVLSTMFIQSPTASNKGSNDAVVNAYQSETKTSSLPDFSGSVAPSTNNLGAPSKDEKK